MRLIIGPSRKESFIQRAIKMSSYSQVDSWKQWGFFILCGVIFLLFPTLGILIASFFAIKIESRQLVLFLIVFLALYLSALNTTKEPNSDMVAYLDMFNSVSQNGYYNTLTYMARGATTKDVGYATLVYIMYYLFSGNQYLFIFTISSIIFSFFFIAIYKLGVEYKQQNFLIVAELLVIAFFTQYFSLTFHLVRQELATSIFFYALVYRGSSMRNFLIWSVVAASMHSSVVAIIFFSIIPFMNQELTVKKMAVMLGVALSFVVLMTKMGTYIMDNYEVGGSFGYSVSRMAEAEGAHDKAKSASTILYLFSAILLILCLIETFWNKGEVVYPLIINLCIVWCVLVLGLSSSPLLQYRFYFIEYNFIPFVVFLVFRHYPILLKYVCFSAVLFLIFRFYKGFNNVFQFALVEEALTSPFFMLMKF